MKILIICILILFIVQQQCFGAIVTKNDYHSPINRYFERNSITYEFNENRNYFSKIYFGGDKKFILNFNCTLLSPIRTCGAIFNEDDAKKYIPPFKVCLKTPSNNDQFCDDLGINNFNILDTADYPEPIITTPFTPSTKGGEETLKGIYLMFGQSETVFTLEGDIKLSIIGSASSKDFDATNVKINYPGGCGPSSLIWYGSFKTYTFNHSKPVIDNIVVNNNDVVNGTIVTITGQNFCDMTHKDNISVFIDGKNQSIKSIGNDSITITITDELYDVIQKDTNSTLFIKVYDLQSKAEPISVTLYVNTNVKYPSVNGQPVDYTLYNIFDNNQDKQPTITIYNNKSSNTGITLNGTPSSTSPSTKTKTLTFQIPSGCGKKEVIVKIGNQNTTYLFEYQSPTISTCIITGPLESNDGAMIVCYGNFTDFKSFYSNSNGDVDIQISNQSIQKEFNITDSTLSFPLKAEYYSSDITICRITVTPIVIPITISKPIESSYTFNTKGGNITISGNHFSRESTEKTYFQCDHESSPTTNVYCTYVSHSTSICKYSLSGPKDVKCNLFINGNDVNQQTTISYLPHTVFNASNQVSSREGGVITIIGDQFYKSIDNITVDNQECSAIVFQNESTISCIVPPSKYVPLSYVNVIINGKSSGAYLLVYFNDSTVPTSNSSSSSEGGGGSGFFMGHLKWMIIVIIVGGLMVGWTIYRLVSEFRWSREKGHQRELDEEFDLGIAMERKMYYDYKEREAKMPPIVEPPPPVPMYQSYYFTPYIPPEKRDPSLPIPEDENNWKPPTASTSMPDHLISNLPPPNDISKATIESMCLSLPSQRPLSDYVFVGNDQPFEPIGDSLIINNNDDDNDDDEPSSSSTPVPVNTTTTTTTELSESSVSSPTTSPLTDNVQKMDQ